MGFDKRLMTRERAAAERAENDRRERERGRDVAQARKLVAIWNNRAGRGVRRSFYPKLETVMLAGTP